jgi:hypothetical protein
MGGSRPPEAVVPDDEQLATLLRDDGPDDVELVAVGSLYSCSRICETSSFMQNDKKSQNILSDEI